MKPKVIWMPGEDDLFLWAIVDPEETEKARLDLRIVGTGGTLPTPEYSSGWGGWQYWRTVHQGRFVWHIFQKRDAGE